MEFEEYNFIHKISKTTCASHQDRRLSRFNMRFHVEVMKERIVYNVLSRGFLLDKRLMLQL